MINSSFVGPDWTNYCLLFINFLSVYCLLAFILWDCPCFYTVPLYLLSIYYCIYLSIYLKACIIRFSTWSSRYIITTADLFHICKENRLRVIGRLFVQNNLTNCWTVMFLLYTVALHRSWEGLFLFWERAAPV